VLVVQEKEKIIRLSSDEISSVKISPKLIEKLPNLGEVDVMRSLQLLPGIYQGQMSLLPDYMSGRYS